MNWRVAIAIFGSFAVSSMLWPVSAQQAGMYRAFARAGGLIGYGPLEDDPSFSYRRAAVFVDKLLKGVKAAELPVEQPTKFELAINLKTAKLLDVTIPATMIGRADEVIE
jgi:putative tryptophan/tyrosine transport system substrate-binding protein